MKIIEIATILPNNNVSIFSILHRFRDITTFTVCVTACECDVEKSFTFKKTVEFRCIPRALYIG